MQQHATSTTSSASAIHHDHTMMCKYKTGKCRNQRTRKANGSLHSLCAEHRIKQNLIQRKSDRKVRRRTNTRPQCKAALLFDQRNLMTSSSTASLPSACAAKLVMPSALMQTITIDATGSNSTNAWGKFFGDASEPHFSPTSMDKFVYESNYVFPLEMAVSASDLNQKKVDQKLRSIDPIVNPEEADAIMLSATDLEFLHRALF